ncbi:MAG TPA: LLM class flavin-dependent oxidoreductase [Actinomycetota bacterium]|nr:LLM class flavin-dependent oxidoreductase [Actinomycetota bacterium]
MGHVGFGVTIIPSASGRSDPVAEARRAEELGFDLVAVWDHPHGHHPSFESWTLMTWVAANTSRIRIASNVLGMPFRLPALVAKMAESLDRLSGGRLVLGLGAGGNDDELAAFGAPTLPPEEKVEALEEAIEVIRGVWTEPAFTYDGAYYRNHGALLEPKPARPIPIWLGAYGPRMLDLTGRLADGWVPSLGVLPADRVTPAMDRVRAAAERAGRDPDALDYACNVQVRVGGPPPEDPARRVAGEPEQVVDVLTGLLDLGFSVLNFMVGGRRDEQMELLGTRVLPDLRSRSG